MTTETEIAEKAQAAEAEETEARAKLQRIAASNARIVNALHAARGAEQVDPAPFDLAPILAMAERATGMTQEQLRAAAEAEDRAIAAEVRQAQEAPRAGTIARRRAKDAGAPELHIRNVIDREPRDGEAFAAVRRFVAERFIGDVPEGGFLFLAGNLGTHKSGSACWALGRIGGGEYIEAGDVLDVKINDRARFERLRRAPLVVFDDLGTETLDEKGETKAAINKLINSWYVSCAVVIVTCNILAKKRGEKDPDGFRERYGERAWDRMRERSEWIYIGGESMRKPGGAK